MITLKDITYSYYPQAPAVIKNLNLSINSGEAVCVMGANGSGKSTFAKLVTGLIKPERGVITIENSLNKELLVGLIFQDPDNQMVAVIVENELAFTMENLGYSQERMETLVTKSLRQFSIEDLRRRITSDLSGGEKQRVALASVMISQPDILILDEPDSFLDEKGKKALNFELENIKREKPGIIQISITQYPEVALNYERLIVFHEGEIVADDNPYNILQDKQFCNQTGLSYDNRSKDILTIPDISKTNTNRIEGISLDKLTFNYSSGIRVLKNISGNFKSGEITGIVGYSGCGKSTLGMLLCNLFPPTDGEIIYNDSMNRPIRPADISGKISALFQQPEKQFFLPTCEEEVCFGAKNFGTTLKEDEIKSFFDLVGLSYKNLKDRDPLSLSGGEKRRLAFASVISMSPDFIVFDEPTCSLDPVSVGRFIRLAKILKQNGMGIIIITHDGGLLYKLADRILIIDDSGRGEFMSSENFFGDKNLSRIVSPSTHFEQ